MLSAKCISGGFDLDPNEKQALPANVRILQDALLRRAFDPIFLETKTRIQIMQVHLP